VGNREIKEAKVSEIIEKFQKSQAAVLTSYIGITVEEDTELRKKMRESGVEYKVLKNTLTLRAAKEVGYGDIEKFLVGPVAIAFSYDDPTKPARILADFAKTHKKIELKAGVVQGQIFDTAKINELSKIPPKDVLIAKLLGSFKAPISNLAYALNAVKEKKEANA
jgi:large subunit ribosomal protein L10